MIIYLKNETVLEARTTLMNFEFVTGEISFLYFFCEIKVDITLFY